MAWQSESKSKITGTVDTDATVGGGSQNYSGNAETLAIKGRADTWYVGVQNESTASASDFFIGLANEESKGNMLHIQNDGKIGLGTASPTQELDVSGTINCTGLIVNGTNFSGLSSSSVWTVSTNDISYTAGTVTIGDGSSNKRDFKVFGNASGNHVVLDASADTLTLSNIGLTITGNNLVVGADGTPQDVTFSSDVANSKFFWDGNGDLSGEGLEDTANNEPSLSLGSNGGSEGADFAVFGHTNNKYMWWDCSADQLKIVGTIDVNGTSNFDAVDIDGNTVMAGTLTIGVDDSGHDVIFYGATAGSNLTWDESADDLILNNNANGASTWSGSSLILNDNVLANVATTGNVLSFKANSQIFLSSTDNSKTVFSRSPVHVGTTSAQIDFKIFGTDSGLLFYDVSNPTLDIDATFMDMDLADHAFDLDTTTGAISLTTATGGITIENTGNAGVALSSARQSSSAISLTSSHASGTVVISSAGSGTDAINIDATAGGIDIDGAGAINIDTSSGGIGLGTNSSAQAITLGHTTSEVTVADNLNVNGLIKKYQAGEATTDDGTTAISGADIQRGIVKCTPTADRSKATDSAGNINTALELDEDGQSCDFSVINLATDGSSFITITAGSGVTLVGNMIVSAQDTAEDAFTSGVGMFRVRRTGAYAATIYRIA